jgi:hypothetical protein
MSKLTREQVFERINSERTYQDSINNEMNHQGFPTIEAELLMMEEYLKDSRTKWVHTHGNDKPCLDFIRKVVGIGVRCLEHHGCPERSLK